MLCFHDGIQAVGNAQEFFVIIRENLAAASMQSSLFGSWEGGCTCTGPWKLFKLIHITVIIYLIVFPLTFISGFCIVPFVSLNKDEDKFSRVTTLQQETQAACTWCGEMMIYWPVQWQERVCWARARKKMLKKIISTSFFIYSFFFPVCICTLSPAMKDVLICLHASIKLRFL